MDLADIDVKNEEFQAKAAALPSLAEREEYIIEEKLWSEERNKKIKDWKLELSNLNLTKSKLFRKADIQEVEKKIKEVRAELSAAELEKSILIGYTREAYAQKKANEYYMFKAIYKDESLTARYFTEEEFDDLEETELTELITIHNTCTDKCSEQNLKRIALSPFFLNTFYLCEDNAYHFYNKPTSLLTIYQIELFNHGRYFKHILSEMKGLDDSALEDPDALIDRFNTTKNAEKFVQQSQNLNNNDDRELVGGGVAIMGASKEDIKNAGLEGEVVDLGKEAEKAGGKLSFEQLLKLHNAI